MTLIPKNLPGIDLPRRVVAEAVRLGADAATRDLADAIDQNFREILTRTHQQIASTQVIETKVVQLEIAPPLHAPTHGQNGTDPVAIDWAQIISGTPTTLAGYGITDAYTKTEADARYAPISHTHHLSDILDYGADGGYIRSNGSAWVRESGVPWADITGAPSFSTSYAALTDVSLSGLADKDLPQYDSASSKWKNRTVATVMAAWPGSSAITTVGTLSAGAIPYTLITYTGLTNGAVLRATGATSAAFGAVDLANASAITGHLPYANLPTGSSSWDTGAATTITITHSLTVSGTLTGALTGNASTATALQTARTIGGVSFDGTANITVATATGGFAVSGGDLALGANNLTLTGAVGATGARSSHGWFVDLTVTNAIVGSVTGNAATATALQNARTIGGVSFDGTANITVATATGGFTVSGGDLALGANNLTITGSIGATGARVTKGWFTDLQVTNAIAGSITGSAPTLTNARTIWGQSFDGSANVSGAFSGATTMSWSGNVLNDLTFTDATYDIGKSGATRPRDGFFSRNITAGGDIAVSTLKNVYFDGGTNVRINSTTNPGWATLDFYTGTSSPLRLAGDDTSGPITYGFSFTRTVDVDWTALRNAGTNGLLTLTNNTASGHIVGILKGSIDLAGSGRMTVRAIDIEASSSNTDTAGSSNTLRAIYAFTNLSTAGGRAGEMTAGFFDLATNNATGGTVTTMQATTARASVNLAGVGVSNLYYYRVQDLSNAGTITNTYGFYCGDITAGTQTNQAYSLYLSDTNARNLLSGNTTFVGDVLFTDATYDIGKSGATRPRDIFASRHVTLGGTLTVAALTGVLRADSGVVSVAAGVGARSIFDHSADANNGTTVETDLYSDTVAAGQLGTNGDKLSAQYGIVLAGAVSSTQQVRAYFGGTLVFDSGALSVGVATDYMDLYVTVIRVSGSVVRVFVSATSNFSALSGTAAYTEVTGLTLSNTQVLKVTGTAAGVGGASNQITAKEGYVQWLPAAA